MHTPLSTAAIRRLPSSFAFSEIGQEWPDHATSFWPELFGCGGGNFPREQPPEKLPLTTFEPSKDCRPQNAWRVEVDPEKLETNTRERFGAHRAGTDVFLPSMTAARLTAVSQQTSPQTACLSYVFMVGGARYVPNTQFLSIPFRSEPDPFRRVSLRIKRTAA